MYHRSREFVKEEEDPNGGLEVGVESHKGKRSILRGFKVYRV